MTTLAFPNETPSRTTFAPEPVPELPNAERKGLTKKDTAADHPTWCPGCGDFSVLALYFKLIEKRKIWHEKICTIAGIGCSSRFPYFVQAHGAHFIHGRALAFASGVSLSRPDLHVFVFGGRDEVEHGFLRVARPATARAAHHGCDRDGTCGDERRDTDTSGDGTAARAMLRRRHSSSAARIILTSFTKPSRQNCAPS
jgi:hypothetical protein